MTRVRSTTVTEQIISTVSRVYALGPDMLNNRQLNLLLIRNVPEVCLIPKIRSGSIARKVGRSSRGASLLGLSEFILAAI